MNEREKKLLRFISGVACTAHGKIRADANALLREYGLPEVPLSADPTLALQAQDRILAEIEVR